MKKEHSPLPWYIESGFAVVDADCHTVAAFSASYPEGPIQIDSDDAEFIVKAVNAHAGLVQALKNARLLLANVDGLSKNNISQLAFEEVVLLDAALAAAGVK